MIKKIQPIIICIVLIINIITLYIIKNKTANWKRSVQNKQKIINKMQLKINILNAELAYLTTPEKIKKLVLQKNLKLKKITPKDIIRLPINKSVKQKEVL